MGDWRYYKLQNTGILCCLRKVAGRWALHACSIIIEKIISTAGTTNVLAEEAASAASMITACMRPSITLGTRPKNAVQDIVNSAILSVFREKRYGSYFCTKYRLPPRVGLDPGPVCTASSVYWLKEMSVLPLF